MLLLLAKAFTPLKSTYKMYFHWDEIPAVRLLLPFLMGILLFIYLEQALPFLLASLFLCFILLLLLNYYQVMSRNYRWRWLYGALLSLFCLIGGYYTTQESTPILKTQHFSHHLTDSAFAIVQVEEPLLAKKKSFKTTVSVLEINNGTKKTPTIGQAIVYLKKDSLSAQLKYGDWLLVDANFKNIQAPKNPHEFDYQAYLRYQNIYHQAYFKAANWRALSLNNANGFYLRLYQLRAHLLAQIQSKIKGKEQAAVASALLLGYKHHLQEDLVETYSNTGAMHVLAVSGLHVGIIFMILNLALTFLDKRKYWAAKWVKIVLVLTVIWGFALITGLPPSVCRAATMFSLWIVAQIFSYKTNTYNIIGASALILLFSDPYLIKYVGFQLSYMAVLAIVYLQPKIYLWLDIDNWLGDKVWQITAVSIAAQMGTLPLSLYYFNQFPLYFLLSNLVVIPAATLLLTLGVFLFLFNGLSFIFSPFDKVAHLLGIALNFLIDAQNFLLQYIQQLPFSTFQGLSISSFQYYLLYAIMGSLVFFFLVNQAKYLKLMLLFVLFFLAEIAWQQYESTYQSAIHIYHINNGTAIEFVEGRQSIILSDSLMQANQSLSSFHVTPNHQKMKIAQSKLLGLKDWNALNQTSSSNNSFDSHLFWHPPFVQFHDKKLLILNNRFYQYHHNTDIQIDYLILSQNIHANLYRLNECVHFNGVIMDASNSPWRIKKWKQQCLDLGIPYYDIRENGAFVEQLGKRGVFEF